MAQPRDDGGLGTLRQRDPLRARDGSAADRHRVLGHRARDLVGQDRVPRREAKELDHRGMEFDDIRLLRRIAPRSSTLESTGPLGVLSLELECCASGRDVLGRRPHTAREQLASTLLADGPRRTGSLDAPRQSGVAWRQQRPTSRHGEHQPLLGADVIGGRADEHLAGTLGHAGNVRRIESDQVRSTGAHVSLARPVAFGAAMRSCLLGLLVLIGCGVAARPLHSRG